MTDGLLADHASDLSMDCESPAEVGTAAGDRVNALVHQTWWITTGSIMSFA